MEADVLKTIGENTRKYRTRAGLTQAELAEKVGVGTSFISRVERGEKRMRIETILLVAAALHISVDLLLCPENESKSAQLQTLVQMLETQSPEFLDSIILLVQVCLDKFASSTNQRSPQGTDTTR